MADVTDTYPESNARVGYGIQLKVGQGDSPETFTAVPYVNTITPGDATTEVADVTHLRSPNRHREKLATIRDSGAIAFEMDYDPTHGAHKVGGGDGFDSTHSLISLWRSVAKNNFRIQLIDPLGVAADQVIELEGTVTKYQIGQISVTDPVKCMVEITPLHDYFTGPGAL